MSHYHDLEAVERVDMVERALDNLETDADMLARMDAQGYDDAERARARDLVKAARKETRAQDREYGEQYDATDDVADGWTLARPPYMRRVKLARLKLKGERGMWADLGLDEKRKRKLGPALDQAVNFYTSALARPEVLAKLKGIPKADLEAGLAQMEAVYRARSTQQGETGDARTATKEKRKALMALDEWAPVFFGTAREEFADEPERLARLGL